MVTVVISFFVYDPWNAAETISARKAASGAQCVIILLALVHSWCFSRTKEFGPQGQDTEADIRAAGFDSVADFENDQDSLESSLRRYTKRWQLLLLSWVPLYLLLAIGDLNRALDQILFVGFNILNTWTIVLCFNALNKDPDDEDGQHLPSQILNATVFIVLVAVLVATMLERKLDRATLLTGIASGVFMALYVGRLQSKFLGPRFWILYLLYSYTAIQPLALYIKTNTGWGVVIVVFALFLKCLLYLYMTWLLQSGLLLFYFARTKRSGLAVREQRKAFRRLLKW